MVIVAPAKENMNSGEKEKKKGKRIIMYSWKRAVDFLFYITGMEITTINKRDTHKVR